MQSSTIYMFKTSLQFFFLFSLLQHAMNFGLAPYKFIKWFTDWLIYWLIDWLIGWLIVKTPEWPVHNLGLIWVDQDFLDWILPLVLYMNIHLNITRWFDRLSFRVAYTCTLQYVCLKRDSINKLLPFFCRYMRWCVCNNVCNELVLFALLEDTFVGILHTVHKQIYEQLTF